jgi:hypothetical protein
MALYRLPRADSRYMEEAHRLPVVVFFYLEAGERTGRVPFGVSIW